MYICFSVHWITILHSFYHQSIFLQLHVFLAVQMTKPKEEAAAHHWGQVTPAGWRRRFTMYLPYAHPVLWFVSWNPKNPMPMWELNHSFLLVENNILGCIDLRWFLRNSWKCFGSFFRRETVSYWSLLVHVWFATVASFGLGWFQQGDVHAHWQHELAAMIASQPPPRKCNASPTEQCRT